MQDSEKPNVGLFNNEEYIPLIKLVNLIISRGTKYVGRCKIQPLENVINNDGFIKCVHANSIIIKYDHVKYIFKSRYKVGENIALIKLGFAKTFLSLCRTEIEVGVAVFLSTLK